MPEVLRLDAVAPPQRVALPSLDASDRRYLADLLSSILPAGAQGMRAWYDTTLANLPRKNLLLGQIDYSSGTVLASKQIVSQALKTENLWPTRERSLIGIIVRGVINEVFDEKTVSNLNRLLLQYQMELPADHSFAGEIDWQGTPNLPLEVITNEETIQPVWYLESASQAAKAVVFISTPRARGTGFLIAQDTVITCAHVFDPEYVESSTVTFFYEFDPDANLRRTIALKPDPGQTMVRRFGGTLDYAIFKLLPSPEEVKAVPPLRLSLDLPEVGSRVSIIQHPQGQPKQVCQRGNLVQYADFERLQYTTSTEKGSSGSPVLTDGLKVCGLHCRGSKHLIDPVSGQAYARNEGLTAKRILEDLRTVSPELHGKLLDTL